MMRADASATIGTGHVARCLTLADELAGHGWEILIVTSALPPYLRQGVLARGFQLIEVPGSLPARDELAVVRQALAGRIADLTVVDHYDIGLDWHRAARTLSSRIMVIDDLAIRQADADLLLNQNLGERADRYAPLVPDGCHLLIGPRYALLRPQFARARRSLRVRSGMARLLVFLSGSDEHDVTSMAAGVGADLAVATDVVVGSAYPHWDRLRAWAEGNPAVALHHNVDDMASLMASADLSIGAPSSASWERCCVGLPAILITLADNQRRAAAALADAGAGVTLGWYEDVTSGDLVEAIESLTRSPETLAAMSRSASTIADGLGTQRVRHEIMRLFDGGSANA